VKEVPIRPDEAGGGLPMNIINQIAIMRDARHPNLVEYHGSRLTETAHGGTVVQIVMEFVASGSLAGLLRHAGTLREPVAAICVTCCAVWSTSIAAASATETSRAKTFSGPRRSSEQRQQQAL
jgi:hypothetical protein